MRSAKNLFNVGGTKKAIELKGWGKIRGRSVGGRDNLVKPSA